MHIHHVNLQAIVGGGEIYTRALTRAFADAGAQVSLYVHPANRIWAGLPGVVPAADEEELLARLPRSRSIVVTQSPLSGRTVERLARAHDLVAFAHMPITGERSAEGFRSCRLVVTVSRYCIALLRSAGIEHVYPEPLYVRDGLGIHSRGPAIPLHPLPRLPEGVNPPDAVHQGVKASIRPPLGGHPQPPLECSHVVCGLPPVRVVGSGLAGHVLAPHSPSAPPPQGPFPPAAFTAFSGTTIPSDSRCAAVPFAFGL